MRRRTLTFRKMDCFPLGRPKTLMPPCLSSGVTSSVFSVAKPAGQPGPTFVPGTSCAGRARSATRSYSIALNRLQLRNPAFGKAMKAHVISASVRGSMLRYL